MNKKQFVKEVFKKTLTESPKGRILRVFDFDDVLAKTDSYIYVKHSDGTTSKLDPAEYAVYTPKSGDTFDYKDFNSMLNNPRAIQRNIDLLKRMLDNPQKKVTILTARSKAFPIRYWFKKNLGLDVYVVALGNADPQKKADWIESHIKKGYTSVAFMDDSKKNIDAVDALKKKYPDIEIKTVWITENINEEIDKEVSKYIQKIIN
jgi:hypothetical protein